MSQVNIVVHSGDISDNGTDLIAGLPDYFAKDYQSLNFRLLDVVGRKVDTLDADISAIDRASTVQHADTVAQIEELAKLVGVPARENESKEKYRTRVMAEFQLATTEGTAGDLINNTSTILDIDPSNITYSELPGTISIGVPGSAVSALNISEGDVATIIDRQAAAGYSVNSLKIGTFTYITPTDYNDAGFVHDPKLGYDGLDVNGDPKGNGGTYAGLIE